MTRTTLLPSRIALGAVLAGLLLGGCGSSNTETGADDPIIQVQGARIDSAPAYAAESTENEIASAAASAGSVDAGVESATDQPVVAPESQPAGETVASGSLNVQPGETSPLSKVSGPILSDPSKFKELPKTGKDEGEYKFVSFDLLSGYEYFLVPTGQSTLNDDKTPKDQIPKYVRDLNGTKVVIEGYMVPIDVEGERIKSFILTNSRMMCCYGAMPWINEWIFVEMENKDGADFFNDTTIRVKGTLDVGEEIEDGMVISLYRMRGDSVASSGGESPTQYLYDY